MNFSIGQKIKCISKSEHQKSFGNCKGSLSDLEIGNVYTIKSIDPHKWHTKFFLAGLVGSFNIVMFEAAE